MEICANRNTIVYIIRTAYFEYIANSKEVQHVRQKWQYDEIVEPEVRAGLYGTYNPDVKRKKRRHRAENVLSGFAQNAPLHDSDNLRTHIRSGEYMKSRSDFHR